jgi:pilus assembly protein CpaB
MKSRLIAGVTAVVLALVGAMMLYGYAQGSEARAVQGLEPVTVLVVNDAVPIGTPTEELAPFLRTETLPGTAVGESALKNLDSFEGKVTAVDLVPGEQLFSERLIDPPDPAASGSVDVPEGLQEVSFTLEPHRAVGGKLAPGDTVGIFISMNPGPLPEEPQAETTQLVLHKVLVTAVQRAPSAAPVDPDATPEEQARTQAETLPDGALILTVAVSEEQATKVVFGNEFETIWLSKEPASAVESPEPITIHDKVLYR